MHLRSVSGSTPAPRRRPSGSSTSPETGSLASPASLHWAAPPRLEDVDFLFLLLASSPIRLLVLRRVEERDTEDGGEPASFAWRFGTTCIESKKRSKGRGEKEGGAAAVGDLAGGAVQKADEADVGVREGVSTGKRQAPQPHA
ncbi:hypothetical protein B296_00055586 [Ensete ventricosum]|uniref:Uncharacterized protein n=1 Tax=Ensete ventricosum TaxID=4639 RepID=A0A426XYW8_ENSVE|nr:hypothetical protein B296_00055586 [Ensete ventricosum]